MPGGDIDAANPAPPASHIPDDVLKLAVKLEKTKLEDEDAKSIAEFWQACNYIAAGTRIKTLMVERSLTLSSDDLPLGQRPS